MRSRFPVLFAVVFLLAVLTDEILGWGFWAHREIHRHAIRSLPSEMRPFFDRFADSIIARSVEPDLRRNVDENEAVRHFIDIDRYGAYPFKELPRNYEEAVGKYGKERVDSNGLLPWVIEEFTERLAAAMKEKDVPEIIRTASYLGHYIADAHVPLHTTENYDGQLTNQRGVHSRWESRLPELFGKDYRLGPGRCEFLSSPLAAAFGIVLESFQRVDSVLVLDLKAREGIPDSELMRVRKRNGRTEYQMSDRYYTRYHALLGGMVERQLQAAIGRVASYWYTAWVNAGKPELPV